MMIINNKQSYQNRAVCSEWMGENSSNLSKKSLEVRGISDWTPTTRLVKAQAGMKKAVRSSLPYVRLIKESHAV